MSDERRICLKVKKKRIAKQNTNEKFFCKKKIHGGPHFYGLNNNSWTLNIVNKPMKKKVHSKIRMVTLTSSWGIVTVAWPLSANKLFRNFGVKLFRRLFPLSFDSFKMFLGVTECSDYVRQKEKCIKCKLDEK